MDTVEAFCSSSYRSIWLSLADCVRPFPIPNNPLTEKVARKSCAVIKIGLEPLAYDWINLGVARVASFSAADYLRASSFFPSSRKPPLGSTNR